MTGIILWEGASEIDGAPTVCILTVRSSNRKTGWMHQSWILRSDVPPVAAVKSGKDSSVCGDCPLRGVGFKERACYVNVGQAPESIWHAYRRGSYERYNPKHHAGYLSRRSLRVGAYGDPAAVPTHVWTDALRHVPGWTGYSHQWRWADLREITMASVESIEDAREAWAAGWRTFRIGDDPTENEIVCPAVTHGVQCKDCHLCNGAGVAKSIIIPAHGKGAEYVGGTV